MRVLATLLTTVLVAFVAAEPIVLKRSLVTLPISKRIKLDSSVQNILQHDQLRANAFESHGANKAAGVTRQASSQAKNVGITYIASVGVGRPPTQYDLLVDSGSSNTWVGAGKTYLQTSTSVRTNNSVDVTYGSGEFDGIEYLDDVTIASGLVIHKQSIGVAATSLGFNAVDGILGLGPIGLTVTTLSPDTSAKIPTVTDNLFSAGTISEHLISISFEPITSNGQMNGEITWGGTDSSKFTGSITYTGVTGSPPSSHYWGIDQSITYGSTTILSTTAGIVDTGTTLILIATNAFSQYVTLTGGVADEATGLLVVTSAQFAKLQTLTFNIGGTHFGLTANAQIWPRFLNTFIGGASGKIYLIVADLGHNNGVGLLGFINGQAFLERFYSVFDTAKNRFGLATTPFTKATTN